MSLPSPSTNSTVLVTGASSGIGAELARELAKRGYNLTLVARRRDRLEQLASELSGRNGVIADVFTCDLRSSESRSELYKALEQTGKAVVGVCNNAGFGSYGDFHRLATSKETEQINVNLVALHELCSVFLPQMVERGEGAVLNIASLAGCQPLPRMATYGACKAFVISFSEALWVELEGTGVSTTVLCPGYVHTEFSTVAGSQKLESSNPRISFVTPKKVAKTGVKGMISGKRVAIPGVPNRIMAIFGNHTPRAILLPFLRRFYM